MRRFLLLLALTPACGESREPTNPDPSDLTFVTTSGTIYDSIMNIPVVGVRLLVGDSSVTTDSSGLFQVRHRSGLASFVVNDYRYEALNIPHDFNRSETVILLLRAQAPYVVGCSFRSDTVSATVIDLQGRKTVNRRRESTVTAAGVGLWVHRTADTWTWTPIDNFTWITHVPLGQAGAERADWRIADADGHVQLAKCVNTPPPCHACAAGGDARNSKEERGRED